MKIAILSSFTIEPFQKSIEEKLKDYPDFIIKWYLAPFNQYRQEILNKDSALRKFQPDLIVLAVDSEHIRSDQQGFFEIIKTISQNYSHSEVFVSNCTRLYSSPMRLLEWNHENSVNIVISKINQELFNLTNKLQNVNIIDIDGLTHKYGYDNIFDARFFYIAKMMFSALGINEVSGFISNYIKAYAGKRKKCLVLDLDNTLWGGVLGEVGIENISLSNDGEGKAFYDFQKNILALYSTGTILAVCSKNDKELALEVFDKHPYMLLKREHLAAYKINWDSKVQNLQLIADEINIGIDSLVFLDDSPFEREIVKSTLPQIVVPEMPRSFGISTIYC